jgi:hypothetical protein
VRIRFDDPLPVLDGKPAKYLSPRGAGNLLYVPPGCADRLKDPAEPVYITESEFKALAAWQAGLLTIGLIGVWGWRGKGVNGHSQAIPDLDFITFRDRIIVIAFDSPGVFINSDVQRACYALAMEAYRQGAKVVYTVNLPAPDGVKVGLDDYLLAHGVESFHDLNVEEVASPYPKIQVLTGVELQNTSIERPRAIVAGWGMRREGKGILCGLGGRGKSTLLLQLACDLAAGKPLLNHPQLIVSCPQRVAVCFAEDPLSEVKFRWERQMQELAYGSDVAARIAFLNLRGQKIMLTEEYARNALFAALRQHQADICFLDPLVALHDVDENSNSAMRGVLDLLNPYQEETGCTFWIAHHEPKNPENNGAAARGASAIRDWCRTMLRLTSHGENDEQVTRYTLALDEANYGGSVHSLTLERERDHYTFRLAEEAETVTPLQVWETIGPEERWFTDVLQEIGSKFNVSETTAARAIKRAEDGGWALIGERTNPKTNRKKKTLRRGNGGEKTDEA